MRHNRPLQDRKLKSSDEGDFGPKTRGIGGRRFQVGPGKNTFLRTKNP